MLNLLVPSSRLEPSCLKPPADHARSPSPAVPAGYGLPRAQRIRKRREFVRIQGGSVRVSTHHLLLLLAVAATDDAPARLGVVASRKVGPSVVRNRAKRLVREAFRLHPGVFPSGIDVVVIVRPGTHLLGLAELAGEVVAAGPALAKRARELRARRRG